MAILKNGVFGGFSGKVGNVVGSSWKGIEYIKSRPAKMTNPRTKGQTNQRKKFIVTQTFLRTFKPLIRIGFRNYAQDRMSAFNAAMSYNMKNSIKSEADEVELDFSKVLVSVGPLCSATGLYVEVCERELQFKWNPTLEGNANSQDQAMVLAYNPAKVEAVHDINAGKRSSAAASIILPNSWNDDFIETFLALKNADRSMLSDSIYTGRYKI